MNSGSATINLELNAGQTIMVENWGSGNVYAFDPYGGFYSWFTGHLLYAIWFDGVTLQYQGDEYVQ